MEERDEVLERFMNEMFDIKILFKVGFFKKEMKGDYKAMAERVCWFFGYESVFEYGVHIILCHITSDEPKMFIDENGDLKQKPLITVFKGWLDE